MVKLECSGEIRVSKKCRLVRVKVLTNLGQIIVIFHVAVITNEVWLDLTRFNTRGVILYRPTLSWMIVPTLLGFLFWPSFHGTGQSIISCPPSFQSKRAECFFLLRRISHMTIPAIFDLVFYENEARLLVAINSAINTQGSLLA